MSASPNIAGLPPHTTLTTLSNGLTVIVREDHSAPVVSAQAWCRTGSIHEGKWLGAGLSHVLEHMLFKGTRKREGARIDQEVQEAGGYMNAYTSFDRTVYWINAPDTGATVAIDILADIMQNASLPPETLAKELDVIRREMDMNQDDPGRRSSRRLFETAYTRSPYRHTVIGYPDLFNELKPEDIRGYYEERYAPNNVFFVVAGDVNPRAVIDQLGEAYAGSKARRLPDIPYVAEPKQVGARECFEQAVVELGHLHWSWHVPDTRDPDLPALGVLAVLLGAGRSSRLFQNVREKRALVNSIDAWMYNPGHTGLLGVSAVLDPDKLGEARQAVLEEIERLGDVPANATEISKVVKQCVSATLSTRKSMQGQAQELGGNWLAAHDLCFSERFLAATKRVTPEDVQRVAKLHLAEENRTLYGLLPSGSLVSSSVVHSLKSEQPTRLHRLPNGVRLLIKEDRKLPFVEFRLACLGGVLAETPRNNGATQLLGRMLMQGTKRRSAEQLATEVESLGGSLDTYSGNNSFGIHAEFLSEDAAQGLDFIQDVLFNPLYPAEALERERINQIADIRSQRDHLLDCASKLMRKKLFGNSGYGLDVLGTEESISALTADDLRAAHQALVSPDRTVLAVFGDFDADRMIDGVSAAFGPWKATEGLSLPAMSARKPDPRGMGSRAEEFRDKKQAVVLMGFAGTSVTCPDRYPLELLQEACSDLGSRLFLRIREKLGLAYYVGAQHFLGLAPGFFAFYAGTSGEHAGRVEEEFVSEIRLLREEGLSSEELRRAKNKILGQRKIARQDLGGQAMAQALDELYGLGFKHSETEDLLYDAVSHEDVIRVARLYLAPETAVVARVLPDPKSEAVPQG